MPDTLKALLSKQPLLHRTQFSPLAALIALLAAIVVVWLLRGPQGGKGAAHTYIVLDRSGSNVDSLDGSVQAAAQIATGMDPATDTVTCCRMDFETAEVYDQAAPEDADAFSDALRPALQKPPAHGGTYPAKFFVQATAQIRAERAICAVALFWDGDDDASSDRANVKNIRQAVEDMARNPNLVNVTVYGVAPHNRAALRALFAPLQSRFHLFSADAIDTTPLLADLERARSTKGTRQ